VALFRRKKFCPELAAVTMGPVPSGGCVDCLANGDSWVHLRFCTTCGEVRCCDDSTNQHARNHARRTGHPVIRSREDGENWAWCYPHQAGRELDPVSP